MNKCKDANSVEILSNMSYKTVAYNSNFKDADTIAWLKKCQNYMLEMVRLNRMEKA